MATTERAVVERFVAALAARDREAAIALYTPDALFEAHVPGWDPVVEGPGEIGELLEDFFIGRDDFRVNRSEIVADGPMAALNFDLQWRAAEDGAPCLCFQSHAFALADGRIQLHRMYCAGVRVFRD
jgi:ketosteroid isomerase-like protein